MKTSSAIVKATSIINVTVKNAQKETLGKVEDIMLDKLSGEARYVVLSFGGFLGMGDKLFALPWKAISYSPEDSCFICNIDKEKLKNAQGFDKDNWPDMADQQWVQSLRDYYGENFD
jgi:hypothetical protein